MIPQLLLIETEEQYRAALARIEVIFIAKHGTPEGAELERLVTAVEEYEDKVYPIGKPS